MGKITIGHHISQQFNTELEDIRNRVMAMGGLVEQQLADGVQSLVQADVELGTLVASRDYQVNAMEVGIDEECTQIIAKRQPTASDLRLIIAVVKTITDLERIGDEAERIGRMAVKLAGRDTLERRFDGLSSMADHVRQMLHAALDAFARTDVETAVETWHKDRIVDGEYENLLAQINDYMMEDPRGIPWALDILWSLRALERIGDRCRNICEYVIYLVQGKDVRHTSLQDVQQELEDLDNPRT